MTVPKASWRSFQTAETKLGPLSELTKEGRPKVGTQPAKNASAQALDVASVMG